MSAIEETRRTRRNLGILAAMIAIIGVGFIAGSVKLYLKLDVAYQESNVTPDEFASLLKLARILLGEVMPGTGALFLVIAGTLAWEFRRMRGIAKMDRSSAP